MKIAILTHKMCVIYKKKSNICRKKLFIKPLQEEKKKHQMANPQHDGRMYLHMLGTDAKGPLKRLTLVKGALKKNHKFSCESSHGFYSDPKNSCDDFSSQEFVNGLLISQYV